MIDVWLMAFILMAIVFLGFISAFALAWFSYWAGGYIATKQAEDEDGGWTEPEKSKRKLRVYNPGEDQIRRMEGIEEDLFK
jgi:hypothetical protein